MPTRITRNEAVLLLSKANEENAPVDFVAKGEGDQAIYLAGFVSVHDEDHSVLIYVPGQIAVVFDFDEAEFDYSKPHDTPPEHRAKTQRLMQFAIGLKNAEWSALIRVWKRPDELTVH